ncbi:MAG: alpha/beta hydrolase [Clostridiales bacterium]|nr:alpha/beta hydrolase [Clostridiales bacterium]
MSYRFEQGSFMSSDGVHSVSYYICAPPQGGRAILQLSHGMCEYVRRYDHFASFLCENGIGICGHDHIGHGKSVRSSDELGDIPYQNGVEVLVSDLHTMTGIIKAKYPGLPVILLGHSMGSFIARLYVTRYASEICGFIMMGTGGPESMVVLGKTLAKYRIGRRGANYRSRLLQKLVFGRYNRKYERPHGIFDWISKDKEVVERYLNDPLCGFQFTAGAFYVLFELLDLVSRKTWFQSYPKELPTLIASGGMDPVGKFGLGPKKIFKRLRKCGVPSVSLKIYPTDRHEIINETDKDQVFADILGWIEDVLSQSK